MCVSHTFLIHQHTLAYSLVPLENPRLPRELQARGVKFIGPPAVPMAAMGDKVDDDDDDDDHDDDALLT